MVRYVKQHYYIIALPVLLGLATFIRFWAAPLSTGPDVAQFWAFARVFQEHGLDFYSYADATLDIFPYEGWGFVYPPIWLLILRISLLFTPSITVTEAFVDPAWRLAAKTPIIIADLAIGLLLYRAVPGSKSRKLLFSALWLLHPTAWYESAIFGQFDSIATAFMLSSVIMFMKKKDIPAFILAGLAIMTKQHTAIPILFMIIAASRDMSRRRLLTGIAVTGGVMTLISIPFLLTGNFLEYARSFILAPSAPGYQSPLVFAFSGTGSLLTYLHDVLGWDTAGIIPYTIPVLILALIAAAIMVYRRAVSPLQAALVGYLILVGIHYRINYQYLVVFIPLALLLASQIPHRNERIFMSVLALYPALWVWLTNISWWFVDKLPTYPEAQTILSHFGLGHDYLPDYAYVSFTTVLMCLALAAAVLIIFRWRSHKGVTKSLP